MPETPEVESVERVYEGRMLKVDLERLKNSQGATLNLEIIRHPGAAAIVAVLPRSDDADTEILLLRQFRHATGGMLWEIPAGVLEPGEDPEACAVRELREETGATAKNIRHLTSIYTTPGFTDEQIHLFLATDLSIGPTDHQADELIEVVPTLFRDALQMIQDGQIKDSKTIAALLFARNFVFDSRFVPQ